MPNPMPMSGNCNVVKIWDGHSNNHLSEQNEQPINNTVNAVNQINNITNNVLNERVENNDNIISEKNNVTDVPLQEPINVGIKEFNSKDLELPSQNMTPINNMSTDISEPSKEEEYKTTFNIGICTP